MVLKGEQTYTTVCKDRPSSEEGKAESWDPEAAGVIFVTERYFASILNEKLMFAG